MRFIVLAFTLLLAGCQARFLRDEPLSQLDHLRSAMQVYSDQLKHGAHRALKHLDNTEFKDYKEVLGQSVDNLHASLHNGFQTITPLVNQMIEMSNPMRQKFNQDVEDLRKQIEPKAHELKQVLEKHFEGYRSEVKPFLDEYQDKQGKFAEEMRTKLEPVVQKLKEQIGPNWEETKSKLVPIMEIVRKHMTENLTELKTFLEPYIQDYKDQVQKGALEFRQKVTSGDLKKELNELGQQLQPHFKAIFETIQKFASKE
ncbi:hypothetical protein DNTS_002173 [Danionella cerebrum]|uniref:Apolipoprotein A-I n=1 Tax=Danionella cerebrum TaxID=2873325 RepID=A0A553N1Z0_9TELE|nr:hypothetical protein DNTS_002173 [Danionella translucida]TRY59446.1 hypothetical protein DNTS_002173 [Danionella translucida]